jgi:hypothetical protein
MKLGLVACAIALLCSATGAASSTGKAPSAPTGLHAFVYRANEPVKADHTYSQMPAFAWAAVRGAARYELQIATSRAFVSSTSLYDNASLTVPVASVQLQVPWMTGKPFALWARVRVVARGRTSPWSQAFGFNTGWEQVPQQETAPEGLIRWTPVDGATGYEVWYLNAPLNRYTHFSTLTNVADEREYWTFHPADAAVIRWRVRAVRLVTSGSLPNGISVTSDGPYSPVYTTTNPSALAGGPLQAVSASSNVDSTPTQPKAHQLTPGFAWTGGLGADGSGVGAMLWRVYVFTDKQCVNQALTSSLVGGPAWAPRDVDPLGLPQTEKDLQDAISGKSFGFAAQTGVFMRDGTVPQASEEQSADSAGSGSGSPTGASGAPAPPAGASGAGAGSTSEQSSSRLVSLPDNGWPQGRYWWTVVPVATVPVLNFGDPLSEATPVEYHDTELPQDACAAGQVWPFGVQSTPVTTAAETPYASGVVAGMRVVSAARRSPAFLELPLVSWQPALAASSYEIELSRKLYPWKAVHSQVSVVNSVVLNLRKQDVGTWYYRVRGVNPDLVGPAKKLAWSTPVPIRITGDRFRVVK